MNKQPTDPAATKAEQLDAKQRFEGSPFPIDIDQILGQMRAMVDRVMGESALYAPEHVAIAIKQAHGDSVEASMILRGYRQSLARRYSSEIIDTEGMQIERRISSAFREIPEGQILGPTRDYTQRILDESIAWETSELAFQRIDGLRQQLATSVEGEDCPQPYPRVSDLLKAQDLVRAVSDTEDQTVLDVTKQPIRYPAPRSAALQILARAETGGMMALGYSAMRGQGGDHPTIGELRVGWVRLRVKDPNGRVRSVGRLRVTESANISKIKVRKKDSIPYMSLGYGLCFGQNETKAICMGILDRSMRVPGDGAPAISQEFVLHHLEGPDSHGYANSLKLSEHVAIAAELHDLRAAIARHKRASAVNERAAEARQETELA